MTPTMLIAFVSITAEISVVVTTVSVIIFVTLFMKDEKRKRMWMRFKKLQESGIKDFAKRRTILESLKIQPTDLDNDVTMLHSYILKRRHIGRNEQCDSNRIHQIDIISQEVQEWKKIQKDVKMQLSVLNKAVQQLHQKNSQTKLPNMNKIEH